MIEFSKNILYYPENSGLEILISLDPEESYQFDTILLFKHKESNRYFYAYDSGCSCPTPFKYYYFNSPDDNNLYELVRETKEDLIKRILDHEVS